MRRKIKSGWAISGGGKRGTGSVDLVRKRRRQNRVRQVRKRDKERETEEKERREAEQRRE